MSYAPDPPRLFLSLAGPGEPDAEARHRPFADRDLDVYAIDVATGEIRPAVVGPGDDFRPAIANGLLYWVRNEVVQQTVLVELGDGIVSLLTDHGQLPTWHPHGDRIAFTVGPWRLADMALNLDVLVAPVDRSGRVGTPEELITGYHEDFSPSWSPDGRWLAYHSHRSPGPVATYSAAGASDDIYLRPADGSGPELRLTHFGTETGPAHWASDSRRLAFTTRDEEAAGRDRPWLVEIDPASGAAVDTEPLELPEGATGAEWIAFSPTDDDLAMVTIDDNGARSLWVRPDTNQVGRRILELEASTYGGVDWTPDGGALVFAALHRGRMALWTTARTEDEWSSPRLLAALPDADLLHPQVSPDGSSVAASLVRWRRTVWRMPLPSPGETRSARAPASRSALWNDLEPGAYGVGFTVVELEDRTRHFRGYEGRPIQLSVWYPTDLDARGHPLDYRRYVHLHERPVEALLDRPEPGRAAEIERIWGAAYPLEVRDRWLASRTAATREAPPLGDAFPAVVYVPGFGASPVSHTVTAEYLATHGYVVAAGRSLGVGAEGVTFDSAGLEAQVRDVEVALAELRSRPDVLPGRAAIVGFSFGGGAALLAAMRSPSIRAVVSLDGILGADHAFDLIRATPGYAPFDFRVPLLHIGRPEAPWHDRGLVDELLLAPRHWLEVRGARHLDFIPKAAMLHASGGEATPHQRGVYRSTVRYVRAFLDASLRGTEQAPLSEPPTDPDLDPGSWEVTVTPASAVDVPFRHELLAALSDPVTSAATVRRCRDLATSLDGMPLLTSGELDLATSALAEHNPEGALEVARLWTALHPDEPFAHRTLADLRRATLHDKRTAAVEIPEDRP